MIKHEMERGHRSPSDQKSSLVSIKTSDFCLEGRKGEWTAIESIIIDDSEFFLMEHNTYGQEAAWIIVDCNGNLMMDHIIEDSIEKITRQLREYLVQEVVKVRQNLTSEKPDGRVSILKKLHSKQMDLEL